MIFLTLAGLTTACGGKEEDPRPALYNEIRSANKMVFARMSITKTATLDSKDWYKVGKRIAVYSYDTYVDAYIDLSELTPDDIVVDTKAKRVTVTLPPVKIESSGRDMELRKVYENIGMFRSDLDSKERAEIKEIANESFRREIEANPTFRTQLEESARRKARAYFEALFESRGYETIVDFTEIAE